MEIMKCFKVWANLFKRRQIVGLGTKPPDKFLLTTPFRLLENAFSASLSIPSLVENELPNKDTMYT